MRTGSMKRSSSAPTGRTTPRSLPGPNRQRLAPGDALFFHCNTLHSAGKNLRDAVKFSLVYTYHGQSNRPKAGTRSASKPEVDLR
jgi:ectoine hydroxylase-related dioxygenase (phytanoyl-CoA dioxygenase family)